MSWTWKREKNGGVKDAIRSPDSSALSPGKRWTMVGSSNKYTPPFFNWKESVLGHTHRIDSHPIVRLKFQQNQNGWQFVTQPTYLSLDTTNNGVCSDRNTRKIQAENGRKSQTVTWSGVVEWNTRLVMNDISASDLKELHCDYKYNRRLCYIAEHGRLWTEKNRYKKEWKKEEKKQHPATV